MYEEKEEELEGKIAKEMEHQAGEGEDFFYSADEYAQVRTDSLLPVVVSEEVCSIIQLLSSCCYLCYFLDKHRLDILSNQTRSPLPHLC